MQHLALHLTVPPKLVSLVLLIAQFLEVENECGRENDSVRKVLGEINSYKLETGPSFFLKQSLGERMLKKFAFETSWEWE